VTWQFEEYQKFQKMLQDWRISISMESVGWISEANSIDSMKFRSNKISITNVVISINSVHANVFSVFFTFSLWHECVYNIAFLELEYLRTKWYRFFWFFELLMVEHN
jgi:hypothetical protein